MEYDIPKIWILALTLSQNTHCTLFIMAICVHYRPTYDASLYILLWDMKNTTVTDMDKVNRRWLDSNGDHLKFLDTWLEI